MPQISWNAFIISAEKPRPNRQTHVGDSISEFAKNGVKAEEEALTLYRKIIETAGEMGDWETREVFEKIYGEEEKHLFKFQEYTGFQDEKEEPSKCHYRNGAKSSLTTTFAA